MMRGFSIHQITARLSCANAKPQILGLLYLHLKNSEKYIKNNIVADRIDRWPSGQRPFGSLALLGSQNCLLQFCRTSDGSNAC